MDSSKYKSRYPFLEARGGIWREIASVIVKDTPNVDVVVELGAGYCDFINNYPAPQKIAYEINEQMLQHAASNVEFRCKDAVQLEGLKDNSVDLIFASNFLEHIEMKQVHQLLHRCHQVLRPGGWLVLIQPNF